MRKQFFIALAAVGLLVNTAAAQDFWQQANGPFGGFINALAVHPSNGHIFAVTEGSGVFRSENDGDTWTAVNTNLTELRVYSITIANDPGQVRIFVGTGNSKVFRSADNGNSWELVSTGLPTSPVDVSALIYRSAGEIYAGTRGQGVYKATNYGQAWSAVSRTGLNNTFINALLVDATLNVLAGTNAGIFRLESSTGNWQAFNTGLSSSARVCAFERARDTQNRLYYFAATSAGIYFSTEGNNNWALRISGLTNTNVRFIRNPGLLNSNFSGSTIWAGTEGGGVFRSDDLGVGWREMNEGLANKSIRFLIDRADRIFVGTAGSGVYRIENNGAEWLSVNHNLLAASIKAFAQNTAGQIFAGAWGGGVYRSDDQGGSWTPVNTNLTGTNVAALAINSSGHIFAGTKSGVFRSMTNGVSWTAFNTNLTSPDVIALVIKSNDEVFAGTSTGGIFRRTNLGMGWEAFNAGLSPRKVGGLVIHSNQDIYAGLNAVLHEFDSAIFLLKDGAIRWDQFNARFEGEFITSLAFNSSNDIFAGTNTVVYRSSLTGTSWAEKSTGLGGRNIQSLVVNAVGHIFAATENQSVFVSTNRGDNWTAINGGLGNNTNIQSLFIDANGYIFAGTEKAGAFRSQGSTAAKPNAATDAATNLTSNSARLNGTVNPNNVSTTVTFQYGATASYGSEVTATQSPVSGTSAVAVSANIASGLSPGRTYHFRVVATNTLGVTNGQDQPFTTTGAGPAATTNAATNIGSATATLNATVNPNGLNSTVKFEYGETQAYGNEVSATPSPISDAIPLSVSAALTALSPNRTYHFRVVAMNTAGTNFGTDRVFATSLPAYPSNLTLNKTIPFPNLARKDYRAIDYKIIGLPGNSDRSVAEFLSGEHRRGWQVYWDNGVESNDKSQYLVEYDGSARFKFSPGRAFWVVQKSALDLTNRTVAAALLNANREMTIPLHSGWNLIANPFDRPVAWSRIQAANKTATDSIPEPIWAFNQSFSRSSSFEPYAGYYVYNRTNLDTLRIPYQLYYSGAAEMQPHDPAAWRVHIVLSAHDYTERVTSFGLAHAARQKFDGFDLRKPRTAGEISSVFFYQTQWAQNNGVFATDIRPEFEDQETWDFDVQSPQREELQLTFSDLPRVPAHFEIYLLDEARARYVNLRQDSVYSFVPATDISKFQVLVGKAELLQEKLGTIVPRQFALEQNFPNPFNPSTAIPVTVPVTAEVKLKIYDFMGREVKTLHAGSLAPGRHFFIWDGKDAAGEARASGVYFYRLHTSTGRVMTHKMILIK